MLDHVRGEHEIVGVVVEGEVVAGRDDVDLCGASRQAALLMLVGRVVAGVTIDVERVEVEAVVTGGADLDSLQSLQVAGDELSIRDA